MSNRKEIKDALTLVLSRYEIAYQLLKEIAVRPDCSKEIQELCDGVTADSYTLDDIEDAYFILKERADA